jgi:electron transfer flavoprotein alpha subunit
MMPEVLIIAEHDGEQADPINLDLLAWGAQIAAAKGWKTGVLVAGSGVDAIADQLRSSPADFILKLDAPSLKGYTSSSYVAAIAAALSAKPPKLVLLAHSYVGIELAGGLAAKLKAGLWSNCLSLACEGEGYRITRPIAGGAYVATLDIAGAPASVFSMQRGAAPSHRPANKTPEIVSLAAPAAAEATGIKIAGETKATFAEDITKADLLVAVGRGCGQQSQIQPFEDLAKALGGMIAASRPIIDMGWMTVDHQVGLSGRTVRPKVYLACGISGSAQHLAGMRDAAVIIAVNNDPNAPIFQVAHFGVVADMFDLVPELMRGAAG